MIGTPSSRSFALVEQVLALAHRLAEAADQRALGQAGAEVARVHHVGQLGIGFHEHDRDAGVAVGLRELRVLAAEGREVGLLAAGQHAAGDLVDGLEAEVVGGAQQDLAEPARRVGHVQLARSSGATPLHLTLSRPERIQRGRWRQVDPCTRNRARKVPLYTGFDAAGRRWSNGAHAATGHHVRQRRRARRFVRRLPGGVRARPAGGTATPRSAHASSSSACSMATSTRAWPPTGWQPRRARARSSTTRPPRSTASAELQHPFPGVPACWAASPRASTWS